MWNERSSDNMDEEAQRSSDDLASPRSHSMMVAKTTVALAKLKNAFLNKDNLNIADPMTYDSNSLLTWSAFWGMGAHSALNKRRTWVVAMQLFTLACVVAVPVAAFLPDAADVKVSKLKEIIGFLRFFVGMLLGFFLSSSVNRWYECVAGYLELFDAIRNLQMQFYALGVQQEKIYTCIRYGVLSGWFLSMELHIEKMPDSQKSSALKHMWHGIVDNGKISSERDTYRLISPQEMEVLLAVEDPSCDPSISGCLWMWVGSLVGRMAQDGDIPPMATPTYGRIMNLAQNAHSGIRKVRASVSVQAPFVYAHTLAMLVHINNIVSAATFGVTLGVTASCAWSRYSGKHPVYGRDRVSSADIARDGECLLVNFVTGMIGPFIYQMLLDVSICIAQPFHNEEAAIPTDKLLSALEKDLRDAKHMAENPALWESPTFKKPA